MAIVTPLLFSPAPWLITCSQQLSCQLSEPLGQRSAAIRSELSDATGTPTAFTGTLISTWSAFALLAPIISGALVAVIAWTIDI